MKGNSRIHIFTVIYGAAAGIMLVLSVVSGIAFMVMNHALKPEYTYHGNDAVSGWATIFSAIGYFGGIVGKVLLILLSALCFFMAVYWAAGLVLDYVLYKNNKSGKGSVKGTGTALSILTIIPGGISLLAFFSSLFTGRLKVPGDLYELAAAAVFIGAGVFLIIEIGKN